jgi:hypothetical protein
MKKIFLVILGVALLVSCSSWRSDKYVLQTNPVFDAQIETKDFYSFQLTIKNKSNDNIEILWDKTLYIESNSTNGGFSLGTETYYEEKDNAIPNMIIFPGETSTRYIYPVTLRYWNRGWLRNIMNIGKHGIYLTIKAGDKEYREKMIINVVKE